MILTWEFIFVDFCCVYHVFVSEIRRVRVIDTFSSFMLLIYALHFELLIIKFGRQLMSSRFEENWRLDRALGGRSGVVCLPFPQLRPRQVSDKGAGKSRSLGGNRATTPPRHVASQSRIHSLAHCWPQMTLLACWI